MKAPSALAAFLVMLLPASSLEAADLQPIGSAVVIVDLVTAAFARDTRTLQTGDRVHQDELIEVGLDASSELKLNDDTKLALGPGSRLMLDKFVYDPEKATGSIVLDLVKGSFRFITGVAEKPAYVIKTPAAAITVRGTIFDVYVEDDGTSWLLLLEGGIEACNMRGQCRTLREPGKLIRIEEDGSVGPPSKWASLSGKGGMAFDTAFPFMAKAPSIDPAPAFTRDAVIHGKLDPPKKRADSDKPSKKRAERAPTKTQQKAKATKKTRTAKSRSSDDDNIVSGMDIVIGIGGGIGRGMRGGSNKPRGGGNMDNPAGTRRMGR